MSGIERDRTNDATIEGFEEETRDRVSVELSLYSFELPNETSKILGQKVKFSVRNIVEEKQFTQRKSQLMRPEKH